MGSTVARLLAWHIRTYGHWAYRNEPLSFAIYPLLAGLGPLIVWVSIGLVPALWFLAFAEGIMLVTWGVGLRKRQNRRKTREG